MDDRTVATYLETAKTFRVISPVEQDDPLSLSRAAKIHVRNNLGRSMTSSTEWNQDAYLKSIASKTRSLVFFSN